MPGTPLGFARYPETPAPTDRNSVWRAGGGHRVPWAIAPFATGSRENCNQQPAPAPKSQAAGRIVRHAPPGQPVARMPRRRRVPERLRRVLHQAAKLVFRSSERGIAWSDGGRRPANGRRRACRRSPTRRGARSRRFPDDEYEIGISNLARRLALPKSTVHRLASTLVDAEFLEKNPETGGYRLGLALFDPWMLVRRKMDVVTEARPYLRALMERTGESVHLTVLDHASVLYVNNIASPQAIRMQSNLGARVPAVLLQRGQGAARVPARGGRRQRDGRRPSAARTPKTIVTPQRLRDELALVRGRGYALEMLRGARDRPARSGRADSRSPWRRHRGRQHRGSGAAC